MFGPENGSLWVRTGRGGAAAVAGHDLLIQVTAWHATFDVGPSPEQTSIALDVDPTSLRVHEGVGGMQPLGDDDKENIEQTIDDEILKRMDIGFRSTSVRASDDGRINVQGDLTLVGNVHPVDFDLSVDDGRLSSTFVLKQTDWGMAPYSALFGALKVADEIEITVNAVMPGADRGFVDDAPEWSALPELEYRQLQILDPGVSSFIWALVFFLYLLLGMAAVGVSFGTALIYALLASCFIFLWVRTRGIGRQDG